MAATASGKDHTEPYARLYIGGVDLSGDTRTFSTAEHAADEILMRGWSNTTNNYLSGFKNVGIRGYKALLNDTAVTGAYTALKDRPTNELILAFGGAGEPAVPDPCYILTGVQLSDSVNFDGGAGMITADFLPSATVTTNGNPWGVILSGPTALSSTTNGASHDNAAATTNGYHAVIEAIGAVTGTWEIDIEHSTDDSSWATLASFNDITAIGDQYLSGTGTVNRYVRAVFTEASAGGITPIVGFARN